MASQYAQLSDLYLYGIRAAAFPSTVTDDIKMAALIAASGLADDYLNARYRLPLVSWSVALTTAVCQIAAFRLFTSQIGFNPEAGHNMVLETNHDTAIKWLEGIANAKIPAAGIVDSPPPADAVSRIRSRRPRGW